METEFHRELKSATCRFLRENGWNVYQELALPNHRIADICASQANGRILIIEVKTTLRNYLIHEAYLKYSLFCDAFYVGAPLCEIEKTAFTAPLLQWERPVDRPGLLGITDAKVRVCRQACPVAIAPHRRNAVQAAIAKVHPDRRAVAF